MSRVKNETDSTLDSTQDLTPKQIADGDTTDAKFQQRLAKILDDGLTFVRSSARADDYYSGTTLVESIRERIADIGPDVGAAVFENGEYKRSASPSSPTLPNRVATVVRSLSGATRLEELLLLKISVNAAVDALLGKAKPTPTVEED